MTLSEITGVRDIRYVADALASVTHHVEQRDCLAQWALKVYRDGQLLGWVVDNGFEYGIDLHTSRPKVFVAVDEVTKAVDRLTEQYSHLGVDGITFGICVRDVTVAVGDWVTGNEQEGSQDG